MISKITIRLLIFMLAILNANYINAQEKKVVNDTIKVKEADRNVMLNAAAANAGPREVNIGLPASVGGTTVLENNLPVVYFSWPEMPFRAWRVDAMTTGQKLFDFGQTSINIGDIGFSLGTYDNLGTDTFQGIGSFAGNHFGSHKVDMNLSGPVKNGFKYSLGAYVNMDKGTYSVNKNGIDPYYKDQTAMFKAAVTKDYNWGAGSGSISVLYKYIYTESMAIREYAPFVYHNDGSVTELEGFKIGGDNYFLGQKFMVRDAFTGKYVEKDAIKDYGSGAHTIDVIGKNKFNNGLNFNYIIRGHSAESGILGQFMTGIDSRTGNSEYTYADGGAEYSGKAQGVLILASKKTPIKSLTSLFELGKVSGNHDWKVGVNQWLYDIDKFASEGISYYQTVEADPKKIIRTGTNVNDYGDIPANYEYHNGIENKTALFFVDKWNISELFTLNMGARFEYQTLKGDYINNADIGNVNLDNGYITTAKKTDINKDWLNKAFMLSGVYKLTKKFGLLANANYNEQGGHLENYSAGNDPRLKQSKILEGSFGLFYNSNLFSLVSKATYITRDEYRSTINFTHPITAGLVERALVTYDIQTLGWTTDIVSSPFKNFNLHLLFTMQTPKYKNYSGSVFNSDYNYNYDNNIVTSVSKVLIEIDPSYQWKSLKFFANARYFSKQYANLTNSLYFKGRWETFAGVNYSLNKNVSFSANVVNFLNQRGAQGTISGTDLMTEQQAKEAVGQNGAVLSGTYIRPFTVEFGMKFKL